MLNIENFKQVTKQIETERGIPGEVIISAIEQALVAACRRRFSEETLLEADLNHENGDASIYRIRHVVDTVENDETEISLADAKVIDKQAKVGHELKENVTPNDFGRIAAQTAKQVIIQRIREAEKSAIFDEYSTRVGQIINGTIQRVENQNYLVNMGRAEALLTFRNQIPGETFHVKDTIKVYLEDIERTAKGAVIRISRTHPGLLKCLLELEIPEIQDNIITIMSVSREAGKRAKVAVKSNNPSIGAVGTCVGPMGQRIQTIIKELCFEKIDVLEWSEDPKVFIANALKPAKISQVIIHSHEEKTATVVVPNDQLSLAIGKNGINVRLSVRLTGWKLDILNEEEFNKNSDSVLGKDKLSLVEKMQLEKEKLKEEASETTEEEVNPFLSSHFMNKHNDNEEEEDEELTKVSDLAKMLGYKTKDLIDKAATFNLTIKNVRSQLTADEVREIKNNLES